MVEHLILMMFVPPLVLLGLPVVPLLRGCRGFARTGIAVPLVRFEWLRAFGHWIARPAVAWLAMNIDAC